MSRLILFLLACSLLIAVRAQDPLQLADHIRAASPSPPSQLAVRKEGRKTKNGELVVAFLHPRPEAEHTDSQAVLLVASVRSDGRVAESSKTDPFAFYTAGGKFYVEHIQIASESRFSVQFNWRGSCGGGHAVYRFALVDGAWRLAGRDMTSYRCGEPESGVGDDRTEWSGNLLTGRVIVREFRRGRLVSTDQSSRSFERISFEQFDPSDPRHGTR